MAELSMEETIRAGQRLGEQITDAISQGDWLFHAMNEDGPGKWKSGVADHTFIVAALDEVEKLLVKTLGEVRGK